MSDSKTIWYRNTTTGAVWEITAGSELAERLAKEQTGDGDAAYKQVPAPRAATKGDA